MISLHVLFVATSEDESVWVIEMLEKSGYQARPRQAHSPSELESLLPQQKWDVVFVTPVKDEFPIEQVVAALRRHELDIPCIVLLTGGVQLDLVEAVKKGAHDCVNSGDEGRLVPTIEREVVAAALRYNIREQVVADYLLQEIDQYILNKYDLSGVVKRVTQRMVELFDFKLVWIGMKQNDGAIEIAAAAGMTAYLDGLRVRWDDRPEGQGTTGIAIRENRPVVLSVDAQQFKPWRERAKRFGMRSVLAMPLGIKGEVIGALMLYSQHDDAFDKLTVSRLSAFAARVTVAMLGAQEQQELRLMEVAMNNASNAMFITDREGEIVWLNEALCRFSGYTTMEIIGNKPRMFSSGKHDRAFWGAMWKTVLGGKAWRGDVLNKNKSGGFYTVTQSISPLTDPNGNVTHFLVVQQDISEKHRLEEEIHHLAYHDILTDLPNRMLFQDRVQQEITHAKRGNTQFAVLFIDLDGFKAVNDSRGHAAGDRLLQIIASRLRTCVREGDTVARLGGDEFTILLRGATLGEGLKRVLRHIIKAVAQPCELGEFNANVTASVGISLYPFDATGVEKLLIHADEAMYRAKQAGKNGYIIYGEARDDEPSLEWQI
ncbi:MAG: diguanylate cyclase [Sideroxydans sp.]|jgi:diguanylate cyclase (GGDEF)-like protein/PAS domain S-box-containing protein